MGVRDIGAFSTTVSDEFSLLALAAVFDTVNALLGVGFAKLTGSGVNTRRLPIAPVTAVSSPSNDASPATGGYGVSCSIQTRRAMTMVVSTMKARGNR